jgi:hypothetical protein
MKGGWDEGEENEKIRAGNGARGIINGRRGYHEEEQ